MEELVAAACQYLAGCTQGVVSEVKVLKQLINLLRQYPGGLTEAALMNEIVKVHGCDKGHTCNDANIAQRIPADGSNNDILDQTEKQTAPAADEASRGARRLPLHKLLKTSCNSQGWHCYAEAQANHVQCLTRGGGASSSSCSSGPSTPANGHGHTVSGVWACQLSDAYTGGHGAAQLQLYMHTRQHALLQLTEDGQPWLQGKQMRLSQLKLMAPAAPTAKNGSHRGASWQLPCAAPSLCLLPLLTAKQWQQLPQHLTCITLPKPDSSSVLELSTVLSELVPTMQPGASQVVPGWVRARVQRVEHDIRAAQAVVFLTTQEPDPQLCPLVCQGQELAALASMLQSNEELAVHWPSLQLQVRQTSSSSDPQSQPVLWCMQDSLLVAAQQPVPASDGGTSTNINRLSFSRMVSDAGSTEAGTELQALAPVPGKSQPAVVWARVQSVLACSKLDSKASHGWVAGQGGYRLHAQVQAYLRTDQKQPQRHQLTAKLSCNASNHVAARIQAGHHLVIMGATVQLPQAGSGTACGTLEWQEASETEPGSSSSRTASCLLMNVSCLPAMLTTPALYMSTLCTSAAPGFKHHNSDCSRIRSSSFLQCLQQGAARCLDQPPICCLRLKAISIDVQRVHKLCGRSVTQSMDWSDMLEDEEETGMAANCQPSSAHQEKQDDVLPTADAGFFSHIQDAHLGLWHCELCKREVSGGDVAWALTGSACVQLATHPSLDQQRYHGTWRVPRRSGLAQASACYGTSSSIEGHHTASSRTVGVGDHHACHTSKAADAEEDLHQVVFEPAALLTLCGTSAEVWRTLSFSEQCKRVPELRSAQLSRSSYAMQGVQHVHGVDSDSTFRGRCLLAAVGLQGGECMGMHAAEASIYQCKVCGDAMCGQCGAAAGDTGANQHIAGVCKLHCVQVVQLL